MKYLTERGVSGRQIQISLAKFLIKEVVVKDFLQELIANVLVEDGRKVDRVEILMLLQYY